MKNGGFGYCFASNFDHRARRILSFRCRTGPWTGVALLIVLTGCTVGSNTLQPDDLPVTVSPTSETPLLGSRVADVTPISVKGFIREAEFKRETLSPKETLSPEQIAVGFADHSVSSLHSANPQAEIEVPASTPEIYRIGSYDEIEISVYNVPDLQKSQVVRPDGKISFPLVGEVDVSGLTPEELRLEIVRRLAPSIEQPEVTVIVVGVKSRRVSVIGEVRAPGVYDLSGNSMLLDMLAQSGGVTENADLRFASVIRGGKHLSVSLDNLLRHSDISQNIPLKPNDSIVIPDVRARRVLVMGEVQTPAVVTLGRDITLIESIALARGFKRSAVEGSVLVIRGGLAVPSVHRANIREMFQGGNLEDNIILEAGDIVYVSKSLWASFADFLRDIGFTMALNFILHQPSISVPTGAVINP